MYIFAKRRQFSEPKICFLNYVEYGAVCLSPLLSAHQCSGLRSTAPLLLCIGIVRLLQHFYVRNGSTVPMTMWGMVQPGRVCSPEWPLYGQSRSCHSWPEPNPGHSKMNTLVLSHPARLSFLQVMVQKGSKMAHVTHRAQSRPLKNEYFSATTTSQVCLDSWDVGMLQNWIIIDFLFLFVAFLPWEHCTIQTLHPGVLIILSSLSGKYWF